MDNETAFLRGEKERLTQLLDILLSANQRLEAENKALREAQKANPGNGISSTALPVGNTAQPISSINLPSGNSDLPVSGSDAPVGNNSTRISNWQPSGGKIYLHNSVLMAQVGKYQFVVAKPKLKTNSKGAPLSLLHLALRSMLKKGTQAHIFTTAAILQQLHQNPATPMHDLQKLTALSYDGIAKRIMMLKKTGFIVKRIAPSRFLLTDKALQLFEEA